MYDKKFEQVEVAIRNIPERTEISDKYKWNLIDIFRNDEDWENVFKSMSDKISGYKKFEATLADRADNLLACFKFDEEINITLDQLHLYAMLSKDSDMRAGKYHSMDDRIKSLYSQVGAESSFIRPELLKISDEKLLGLIESNKELKTYKQSIDDLLRSKKHTLSNSEEKILAMSSELTQTPYNTFSILTNSDIKLPFVKDENGEMTELSHGRYYSAMYSKDRGYRARVFEAYLGSYKSFINTFTVLFNGNLKTNIFNARARNFNSALESALHKNNIPASVYNNLIDSASKNLQPMHRWAGLKKKLLGVEKLCPYDVYVTVFNSHSERKYTYEEGLKLF